MTPDELWEKYANDEASRGGQVMCIGDFLAALAEYGQAVRDRDKEIATDSTAHTAYQSKECYRFASYIAAAISREPLP
jgi:hypothetical protein